MRECSKNIAPGRNIYGDAALFQQAQRTRRAHMYDEYLRTLSNDVRARVRRDCESALRDLGIDP